MQIEDVIRIEASGGVTLEHLVDATLKSQYNTEVTDRSDVMTIVHYMTIRRQLVETDKGLVPSVPVDVESLRAIENARRIYGPSVALSVDGHPHQVPRLKLHRLTLEGLVIEVYESATEAKRHMHEIRPWVSEGSHSGRIYAAYTQGKAYFDEYWITPTRKATFLAWRKYPEAIRLAYPECNPNS